MLIFPIMLISFLMGFESFSTVTTTFLKANFYTLNAAEWASVAVFMGLPWSQKIVFANFIDNVPIFGSNRKSYMLIGAALIAIGQLILLDLFFWHVIPFSQYTVICLAEFLAATGFVICDIVADTMLVEVVQKDDNLDRNLAKTAIWTRYSLMGGSLLASAITGLVAMHFSPEIAMILWLLLIPVPILVIVPFVKFTHVSNSKGLDILLFKKSILFCILLCTALFATGSQFLMFLITLGFILHLSREFLPGIPQDVRKAFIMACIAVFCFRVIPGAGAGVQWWMIGELGLDKAFFGSLMLYSNISAIVGLALISKWIIQADLRKSLILLTLLDVAMNAPIIMAYYDFTFGFQKQSILMFDAILSSPISGLAMIPLHVLLSKYAPSNKRATFIALSAAFVNSALMLGTLISKGLNMLYPVTQSNFDNLGKLLLSCLFISLLFSIVGIILIKREK